MDFSIAASTKCKMHAVINFLQAQGVTTTKIRLFVWGKTSEQKCCEVLVQKIQSWSYEKAWQWEFRDKIQLSPMNSWNKLTKFCMQDTVAWTFWWLSTSIKDYLLSMGLSQVDYSSTNFGHNGYQNNLPIFIKLKRQVQLWHFFSTKEKRPTPWQHCDWK